MKDKTRIDNQRDVASRIMQAMNGIRFGSLEIVIHDSKIVRVERHEKIRFETDVEESSKPFQD